MIDIETTKKQPTAPAYKGRELIRAAKGVTRDLLSVLLEPETLYTEAQVDCLLEQTMKKEVTPNGRR